MFIVDGAAVSKNGFFYGYTSWAWASITIQSFGGILLAVVVKYSDTIMKVIATTLAIILTSILSIFIFDFNLSVVFVGGALLVVVGTFTYIQADTKTTKTSKKQQMKCGIKPKHILMSVLALIALVGFLMFAFGLM